jgi:glycosyltransferase involved in cell wall biosynthesis
VNRCGLVVTTYARADALARVLESIAFQTEPPDELLIAEDDTDALTAGVVARHAARAAYPVRHLTQPHEGYRPARARNAAIAFSRSDFLVMIDGDMVLHQEFVADHRKLARPGYWTAATCRDPGRAASVS